MFSRRLWSPMALTIISFAVLGSCVAHRLDQQAAGRARPGFAVARNVAFDPAVSETTAEIQVGQLQANLTATMGATARPFDDRYSELHKLLWSEDGFVLAAQVQEFFPGGFDDWLFLYNRELRLLFSASDDVLGSAMARTCVRMPAPAHQPLVDQLIADGEVVPGSRAMMKPGTGRTQAAYIAGWLSRRTLLVGVTNDPQVVAVAPDGREQDIAWALPGGSYGDFIPIGAVIALPDRPRPGLGIGIRAVSVIGCKPADTAVPARRRIHPEVKLGKSGRLVVSGRMVVDQAGQTVRSAVLVDGSF